MIIGESLAQDVLPRIETDISLPWTDTHATVWLVQQGSGGERTKTHLMARAGEVEAIWYAWNADRSRAAVLLCGSSADSQEFAYYPASGLDEASKAELRGGLIASIRMNFAGQVPERVVREGSERWWFCGPDGRDVFARRYWPTRRESVVRIP